MANNLAYLRKILFPRYSLHSVKEHCFTKNSVADLVTCFRETGTYTYAIESLDKLCKSGRKYAKVFGHLSDCTFIIIAFIKDVLPTNVK